MVTKEEYAIGLLEDYDLEIIDLTDENGPNALDFSDRWEELQEAKAAVSLENQALYIRLAKLQAKMLTTTDAAILSPGWCLMYIDELLVSLHDDWEKLLDSDLKVETDEDKDALDKREAVCNEILNDLERYSVSIIQAASADEIDDIIDWLPYLFENPAMGSAPTALIAIALYDVVEKHKTDLSALTIFNAGVIIAKNFEEPHEIQADGCTLIREGLTRHGAGGNDALPQLKALQKETPANSYFSVFLEQQIQAFSLYNRFMRWVDREQQPDSIAAGIEALKTQNKPPAKSGPSQHKLA